MASIEEYGMIDGKREVDAARTALCSRRFRSLRFRPTTTAHSPFERNTRPLRHGVTVRIPSISALHGVCASRRVRTEAAVDDVWWRSAIDDAGLLRGAWRRFCNAD